MLRGSQRHFGFDEPGQDGIGLNASPAIFDCQRPDQALNRSFCRRIASTARHSDDAGNRRCHDEFAGCLPRQPVAGGMLERIDHAEQVEVGGRHPVVARQFVERPPGTPAPGIGKTAVDLAEMINRGGKGRRG